ncbi:hypothetical protein [Nonomuraea sp. NPDC049709]|uniref:hypothetical protein n=1 Tax=Nonomuraea sp. NPDC049709 TaxID=3154736 RepID=UPI003417E2BB
MLLSINRYRKDAFVSGMARQMSDGLSCYLVRMGRPVRPPRRVMGSLDAAPVRRVATRDEADAYVRRWIESCR